MPYPNGRPMPDELEADALRALKEAGGLVQMGVPGEALVHATRAVALATLAAAARMDTLADALPGAGMGV